ncbi:hypothetical protein [Gaoshiqia sediminis]|uniref:Uncharacterized protein n=1 Tax=Gaoshiqia sediminis TaxID=2986998 RepID=A0AA41Y7N7_9BACT|nr:hypothetical protein [Gaoshiqia sediminis]MCW0483489.1 hypothetical protein [Gaoshiqia sediminis]
MEQKKNVRRPIGLPDVKSQDQIRNIYQKAVDEINNIEVELRLLVTNDQVTALYSDLLFELLRSKEPESWLISKYVEAKNINIPHLRTDKLKELGLFDLPDYSEILDSHSSLYRLLEKAAELRFIYPLRKLIVQEDDGDFFTLTDDFERELIEATTRFTQNEIQNKILEALETFAKSLNEMDTLGIFNIKKNGINMISTELGLLFNTNRKEDINLVSVNPRAFQNRLLRRFHEGPMYEISKPGSFWD